MESAELRGPSTIYVPEGTGKTVNDGGKAKEVANVSARRLLFLSRGVVQESSQGEM